VPYQSDRVRLVRSSIVGLPELQSSEGSGKKEVWLLLLSNLQSSNALRAAVRKASIGDLLHLAIDCRVVVYPNLSSAWPHLDLLRTGACSAEALECKSWVSRQKGPWGLCGGGGDRQDPPDSEEQLIIKQAETEASDSEPLLQCFTPCGAARSYHSNRSSYVWRAIRGTLLRGCGWLRKRGAARDTSRGSELEPAQRSSHHQRDCSRPALLPLLHVYSHCAMSAHATVLQTTGPGDHNIERQHNSAASKSRLVVAVASAHKSSQGLHMHEQGVGQK
jgi:hypothetical protein